MPVHGIGGILGTLLVAFLATSTFSGLGLPDYYKWRSRSGCSFCFFQRKIEWVGLKENHPEKFAYAKKLEKNAKDHESPFTWNQRESLEELEQPERIAKIKSKYEKQLETLRRKKVEKIKNNPFLKNEDIVVDDNIENEIYLTDLQNQSLYPYTTDFQGAANAAGTKQTRNITGLGAGAGQVNFVNSGNLRGIHIGSNVTEINTGCFKNATGLSHVTFGFGISSILQQQLTPAKPSEDNSEASNL